MSGIKISRQGIDVLGTAGTVPNNLIFDSNLNTFKIILQGTIIGTLTSSPGTTTVAHNLGYAPPISAFMKSAIASRAIPVSCTQNGFFTPTFKSAYTDGTNAYFVVDASGTFTFSYYLLEIPFT